MIKKIFILILILTSLQSCFGNNDIKKNESIMNKLNGVWNPIDYNYELIEVELNLGKYHSTPNVSIIFENDIIYVPGFVLEILQIKEKIKDKVYIIKFLGENYEQEIEIHFLKNNIIKFVNGELYFPSIPAKKVDAGPSIEKIYYITIVKKLSFREGASLKDKRIRMLTENEKIRLLKKGNMETIDGIKGTWIKVITEDGYVGWCFDAYLEGIKE